MSLPSSTSDQLGSADSQGREEVRSGPAKRWSQHDEDLVRTKNNDAPTKRSRRTVARRSTLPLPWFTSATRDRHRTSFLLAVAWPKGPTLWMFGLTVTCQRVPDLRIVPRKMDTPSLRPIKKAKCEEATSDNCFRDVQRLLMGQKPPFVRYKIRNNLSLARKYFDEQGFRTSIIQSPRKGLSIYRDSCVLQNDGGNLADKAFLVTMLGLHPRQEEMDLYYTTSIRQPYCVLLLCERIRKVCQKCLDGKCGLALALKRCEENSRAFGAMDLPGENSVKDVHSLSSKLEQSVAQLMQCVIAADPVIRLDQLHREFEHIQCCNSTLANAHFQLWATENCTCIKEIYWKRSHLQKLERFTIYFYDPESDEKKPVPFRWMPCLSQVVREDLESVAKSMTEMFWSQLLKRGYFASQVMKIGLSEELEKYFLFGISRNPSVPLLLNAHFVPTYQLSFYLHGRAGVGKSSLVRLFSSVMNQVVKEFTDPEMIVRFVKQNLNKAYNVLELELELRPNNNDLSVMSIIQGKQVRRITVQ